MCLQNITHETVWQCYNEVIYNRESPDIGSVLSGFLAMILETENLTDQTVYDIVATICLAHDKQTEKDREFANECCCGCQ